MRALINLLEATIGNSTPPVDPGAEALPRSAFPIVNQNGNPMMDAYLRQQWVQRMKNSLQRIAADLRGGPTTSGIAAQSDLQALFAGLDGAGGDQAEEAALIRSLVGGLSDSLTGSEDARPGSVISVYA
jgi:hypothetical protein